MTMLPNSINLRRMLSALLLLFFMSVSLSFVSTQIAQAVAPPSPQQRTCEGSGGVWGRDNRCHSNPANGPNLPNTVKGAINIMLFIIGVTAVIVIVIEALRFVNSYGDTQAVAKSKNGVIFALVGLVVAALAYAIVNFVLDQL